MLSYVLLPTEQKFTQNFDFVLVHEWIDHRQILHDLREKFPHAQSFAVWSVDSLNIERSPSLLLSSMCLGILNTSRDIFSFVPNPGCGQYYKDKMKGAQIRVGQEYDNKYMRASDYQGLLLSVVTAEINKKSDKSFVRLKNHRLVDPPDLENSVCLLLSDNFKPSEKSVCLIFEDDSCRTVWHRLCDLDLSNQLITERKIYYLSRHPNNIDLELQSISLIPVKHSGKTDQVAAEQDREYHFSLLLDTLRDDKSSEENCRKAASSVYEVQEYKMKFEFSDPNEIACKILAYVIRTGGRLADSPDETSNNELFRTFPSDVKGVLFKKLDLTSLAKLSVVNHELTDAAWKNRFRDYFPWLYQQKLQEGMTNWRSEFIASYKKALTGIKDHEELQSLFDAIGDKSISQLKKVLRFKTFDEKNLFIRNNFGISPFVCAVMNGFHDALPLMRGKINDIKVAEYVDFLVDIITNNPRAMATCYESSALISLAISNHISRDIPSAFELAVIAGNGEIARLIYSLYKNINNKNEDNYYYEEFQIQTFFFYELLVSSGWQAIQYFLDKIASFTIDEFIQNSGDGWRFINNYTRELILNATRQKSLVHIDFYLTDPYRTPQGLMSELILYVSKAEQYSPIDNSFNDLVSFLIFRGVYRPLGYNKKKSANNNVVMLLCMNGPANMIACTKKCVDKLTWHTSNAQYKKEYATLILVALRASQEGSVTQKQRDDIINYHKKYGNLIKYFDEIGVSYALPQIADISLKYLLVIENQPEFKKKWGHGELLTSHNAKYAAEQYELAISYEQGLNLEQDPKQAFDLYRRAARHGHRQAILAVARIYEQEGKMDLAEKWHSYYDKLLLPNPISAMSKHRKK